MSDHPSFDYTNQPYIADLVRYLAENPVRDGAAHHVVVEHDDWCLALHGAGLCVCRPTVRRPNRKERRRLTKTKRIG